MYASFKSDLIFLLALATSIWFLLTSWIVIYNVILSVPFGAFGYFLWKTGEKTGIEVDRSRFIYVGKILKIGCYIMAAAYTLFVVAVIVTAIKDAMVG